MLYEILSGAIMMACFVAGLFFFKFWRKTNDKLFFMFALAFWMLSLERMVLGYLGTAQEVTPRIYFIRLSAFALILGAIIIKNRESSEE